MKLLPCGNHRRTLAAYLAQHVQPWTTLLPEYQTHRGEEHAGLPGQPTLVHRALLRVDRYSALSNSDDNEHNESNIFNRHKGIRNPT